MYVAVVRNKMRAESDFDIAVRVLPSRRQKFDRVGSASLLPTLVQHFVRYRRPSSPMGTLELFVVGGVRRRLLVEGRLALLETGESFGCRIGWEHPG